MHFYSLANTSIATLTKTFNEAFANYELSLQMTPEMLQQKIDIEDIDLDFSVGAFDGNALAAFIFWGVDRVVDKLCAWDGGTGVAPSYRGQQLTKKMFNHSLPLLKGAGVSRLLLEVLQNNKTACNIYKSQGFTETRLLHAYEGNVSSKLQNHYLVEEMKDVDDAILVAMADWTPAWQQMSKRVKNRGADVTTIGIRDKGVLIAYLQHHHDARRNTTRVCQFAVAKTHRRKGMGTALFQHLQQTLGLQVSVVNVDARSGASNSFMAAIGLKHLISQYEMEMFI